MKSIRVGTSLRGSSRSSSRPSSARRSGRCARCTERTGARAVRAPSSTPGSVTVTEDFTMTTYLINHLRIPGGVPNEAGLSYLEQVESTVKTYGGKWLAQGAVQSWKVHGRAR